MPHLAGVVVGWSCDRQVRFFFIGQIRRVDDQRMVVVWVARDSEWRVWLIGEQKVVERVVKFSGNRESLD